MKSMLICNGMFNYFYILDSERIHNTEKFVHKM